MGDVPYVDLCARNDLCVLIFSHCGNLGNLLFDLLREVQFPLGVSIWDTLVRNKSKRDRNAELIQNKINILTAAHLFMIDWLLGGVCKQEELGNGKLAG